MGPSAESSRHRTTTCASRAGWLGAASLVLLRRGAPQHAGHIEVGLRPGVANARCEGRTERPRERPEQGDAHRIVLRILYAVVHVPPAEVRHLRNEILRLIQVADDLREHP